MNFAELELELRTAQIESERLKRQIKLQNDLICKANAEKIRLERTLQEKNNRAIALEELKIVKSSLPKPVLVLRKRLTIHIENAKSENITIARKKQLDAEINKITAELHKTCPHTFILSYDGYEGSYLNEYSDARHGHRRCVICGFSEFSGSTKNDEYHVLTGQNERLIKRDLREEKKWPLRDTELENLDFVFETFRRSAGDRNIHWPVFVNGELSEKEDLFRPGY